MNKIKNKLLSSWVLYNLFFICLISFFTLIFLLNDKSLIWNQDGMSQHFPILINFHENIINWINHPSLNLGNWSNNIGLGADQLTSFSYYVTGDLFNYLIVFFPKNHIEFGYDSLIILRLYFAGLSFILYAKLFTKRNFSLAIGALIYTFSSYSMLLSMHHPFFILPLIFLPLLCYGIEKILKNKNIFPLTIGVFLTLIGNFYFAYMLAITCFFYFIVRIISVYPSIKKRIFKTLVKVFSSLGIGILLSGIILIPTILFVINSTRTNSIFANGFFLYPLNYYLSIPGQLLTFDDHYNFWLLLGYSGISFIAVIYTMSHFKNYLSLNIFFILIGIGTMFPFVSAVFNAFSTPSNRWTLIAIFPLSLATVFFLNKLFNLSKKDLNVIVISIFILLLTSFITQGGINHSSQTQFFSYLLLLILIVIIYFSLDNFWSKKRLNLFVGTVILINLSILGNNFFNPTESKWSNEQLDNQVPTEYLKNYYNDADNYVKKNLGNYQTTIGANYHKVTNPSNFLNTNSNASLVKNTKEITSYLSVQNGYLGIFSTKLNNNQFSYNTPIAQGDYRTSLLNMLGVKYLFIHSNQIKKAAPFGFEPIKSNNKIKVFKTNKPFISEEKNTGTVLLENKNILPIIYNQNSIVTQTEFNKLNPVDRERSLVNNVSAKHKINGIKSSKEQYHAKKINYTVQMDLKNTIDNKDKVEKLRSKNPDFIKNLPTKNYSNNDKVNQIIKDNQKLIQNNQRSNKNGLKNMTTDNLGHQMSYFLKVNHPEDIKNKELYLLIDGIESTDFTRNEQLNMRNKIFTLNNLRNPNSDKIKSFRKNLFHNFNGSYTFKASTNGFKNGYTQYGNDNLSNYQKVHSKLINLGYYKKERKKIELKFKGVKNLKFRKVQLLAVDFNQDYQNQIKKIQSSKFKDLKVSDNKITGLSHQPKKTIMTTRIPYSKGWKLTIDNKEASTFLVNQSFIGATIPGGTHKIKLIYKTPGIIAGYISTVLGLIISFCLLIWISLKKRIKFN